MKEEDLQTVYSVTGNYHDTLVGIRFTVAGLYLTASAFLATIIYQNPTPSKSVVLISSVFAIILTILLWLMEIRNSCLLENLDDLGKKIEDKFELDNQKGFFDVMKKQDIQPCWPFGPFGKKEFRKELPSFLKPIVSHRVCLSLIYITTGLFWVISCYILTR